MKKLITLLSVLLVVTLFTGCSLLPTSSPVKKQVTTNPVAELFNYDNMSYHPSQVMVQYSSNANLADLMASQGATVIEEYKEIGWALVSVPQGKDVLGFIKGLRGQRGILMAEPNLELYTDKVSPATDYNKQWGHVNANAEAAWDITTGSADVIVAVIDTGVDINHTEFADKTFVGAYDATGETETDVTDRDSHGTHVAGIAADNGMGGKIAGVAWDSPIMPIRAENSQGKIYTSYLTKGMIYVADYVKANPDKRIVVNMSIGGRGYNFAFKDAIDYAFEAGVLLVTSAGNDHKRIPNSFPSAYNGVVSVAASTPHDTKADFSTVGSFNSIAAPGVLIYSTVPGGYANMQGTSMASPYVAGAAALMLAKHPTMTPLEMKNQIEQTARGNGFTEELGYGIIDVAAMLGEKKPMEYGSLYVNTNITDANSDMGTYFIGTGIVTVYDATGNMVGYGTTGQTGNHNFPALKQGDYKVSVTYYDAFKNAYEIQEQNVSITASGKTTISFDFTVPTYIAVAPIAEFSDITIEALVSAGDPVVDTTVRIDADGYYEFWTYELIIGEICDTVLDVYDASGKLIGHNDYGDFDMIGLYLTAGTYTVRISEYELDEDLKCKLDTIQVTVTY